MNYIVVKKHEGQKDTDTRHVGDISQDSCSYPTVPQWVSAALCLFGSQLAGPLDHLSCEKLSSV